MKDLLRKGIFLLSVLPSTVFLPKPSYHSLGAASNNYCAGQAATRHFGTWRHHHLDENWITCVDIQKIKFQHLHLLPPKRNQTEKHDATKNLTSLVHKRICNPGIASYMILQQEESLRLLKVWVMTWSVPDRIIMSILRGRCGTVNIHPVLNLIN